MTINLPNEIYTYKLHPKEDIINLVPKIVNLESYPAESRQLLQVHKIDAVMMPLYHVTLSIHQAFTTSVGVIIDEIDVNHEPYLFSGVDGDLVSIDADFYPLSDMGTHPLPDYEHATVPFQCKGKQLQHRMQTAIIKHFTRQVRYVGGNNVTYSKKCSVNKRNIHIEDIAMIHVPTYDVEVRALQHRYKCSMTSNASGIKALNADWKQCHYCGSTSRLLLCNECGRVTHTAKKNSCGVECNICHKTLCKDCAHHQKRKLFFKYYSCSDCK